MTHILTAEDFMTIILSKLKLLDPSGELEEDKLDWQFDRAHEILLDRVRKRAIKINFSFFYDPLYGNSVTLRNALLYAKERHLLEPSAKPGVFQISLTDSQASEYLSNSSINSSMIDDIVKRAFGKTAGSHDEK